MNALDVDNEIELIAEIDDLASYLQRIPADLRESGAFTPYEVRLRQLLESLLTLRLKQTLHRYESGVIAMDQRSTYEEVRQWVHSAERRHEEAAHDYLRMVALLNDLVSAQERR